MGLAVVGEGLGLQQSRSCCRVRYTSLRNLNQLGNVIAGAARLILLVRQFCHSLIVLPALPHPPFSAEVGRTSFIAMLSTHGVLRPDQTLHARSLLATTLHLELLHFLIEFFTVPLSHPAAVAAAEAEVVEALGGAPRLILARASWHLLANMSRTLPFTLAPRGLDERVAKLLEAFDFLEVDRSRTVAVLAEANDAVVTGAAQIGELPGVAATAASEQPVRVLGVGAHFQEVLGVTGRTVPRL